MNKLSLSESALNRLLNFMDELEAPVVAEPGALGAEIDAALVQPTPEMPEAPGVAEALVMGGLGLEGT